MTLGMKLRTPNGGLSILRQMHMLISHQLGYMVLRIRIIFISLLTLATILSITPLPLLTDLNVLTPQNDFHIYRNLTGKHFGWGQI